MNESQLKSIPTLVLGDLPPREREHYFKFLVENEVQFVEDEHGYFVAVIRVINPKLNSTTTKKAKGDKQRLFQSTFSYQQKVVSNESPKEEPSSQRSKSKTPERKRNISPFKPDFSPNQMKGISDFLDQDMSQSFKNNGESMDTKRSVNSKTPDRQREDPMKVFLKNTKFQNMVNLLKLQSGTHLRPKILSIGNLIRAIEEIYNAKYKQDTAIIEEELVRKASNKQPVPFPEFVADYLADKYKNRRMIEQNTIDLCQSLETYEKDYVEIKTFSNFLTAFLDSDDLIFFLFVRNSIQKILGLQFAPKFPGQRVTEDTRSIFLNMKQCIKVTNVVFADEESLQKTFISQVDKVMQNSDNLESLINVASFMELFLEIYHEVQPSRHMMNSNLSPFHSDDSPKHQEDTFAESMIHHENEFEGESEILKSLDFSSMLKSVYSAPKDTPPLLSEKMMKSSDFFEKKSNENSESKLPEMPVRVAQRPVEPVIKIAEPVRKGSTPRQSPQDDLKKSCIDYSDSKLVDQFVLLILKSLTDVPRPVITEIRPQVVSYLSAKMTGLIEALFSFDKRRWLELLETDNKESLKHVEVLQKQVRQLQRTMASEEDIDSICRTILQTPELKKLIGSHITNLSQQYANKW
ncbi:unnamed protein product [Blepharisma stoltei]|uniref:Uncharacterized protein n=1 Tax=Blepharisma stoltei TaxID=1481888 RepID=A0AAU9K152_9CILI|nr:unnamed protein product [Blepharisma stoltei]